jgi:aminoglycoside 2''-phosphotransferase
MSDAGGLSPGSGPEPEVGQFRREIIRVAPEFTGSRVSWLGEGMDNRAFLVGDSYVFRFAKHAEAAGRVEAEVGLFPRLAPRLGISIPCYEYFGRQGVHGLPFVGYRLIAGEELTREVVAGLNAPARVRIARDLAAFLTALHAFPVEEARRFGVQDYDFREVFLGEIETARAEVFPLVGLSVRDYLERTFRGYLGDAENFAYAPALMHSDLAPEHVLLAADRQGLAGIIDFDAVIGDPDYELSYPFWAGLGDEFLRYYSHPDPARLLRKLAFADTREVVNDVLHGLGRRDAAFVEERIGVLEQKARGVAGAFSP